MLSPGLGKRPELSYASSAPPSAHEAVAFVRAAIPAQRPLSDEEITWVIACREQLRMAKDFEGADGLREGLKQLGVQTDERQMIWKAPGGRTGRIPKWNR